MKKVDIVVNRKWQATYGLSDERLKLVYKFLDLLDLDQTEGCIEVEDIVQAIDEVHEANEL